MTKETLTELVFQRDYVTLEQVKSCSFEELGFEQPEDSQLRNILKPKDQIKSDQTSEEKKELVKDEIKNAEQNTKKQKKTLKTKTKVQRLIKICNLIQQPFNSTKKVTKVQTKVYRKFAENLPA